MDPINKERNNKGTMCVLPVVDRERERERERESARLDQTTYSCAGVGENNNVCVVQCQSLVLFCERGFVSFQIEAKANTYTEQNLVSTGFTRNRTGLCA